MKKLRIVLLAALALAAMACVSVPDADSSRSVRIVRDDFGVPHIYANDVYGLFFGYGYAVAQDRLFQMEMARRSTQGRVAEVLGEEFVDFDKSARTGFLPASIRAQLAALSQQDRDIFLGYAAGMNAWQDQIRQQPGKLLPRQFSDFGFAPASWTAYDIAMIFVGTMANRYGDFNTELENSQILGLLAARHGRDTAASIFDSLNPRLTRGTPTTLAAEDWPAEASGVISDAPDSAYDNTVSASFNAPFTPQISGFSNCFVLGPDKSEDASAILVNGPQFGWFVPAYVYSVGLHGAGFNMVGNTPFAYPVLLFGHNGTIAWGSTWGAGDIVDIYRESVNPANPNEYEFDGGYRSFETRSETINVKDAPSQTIVARRSVHGPIVAEDQAAGVAYAKRRVWDGKELQTLLAWLHSGRVSNYNEWITHAEKAAFNINWYYADTGGNIGYAFVGHYQDRAPSHDNRFPARGDGSMEWLGRKPFTTNPHALNPSRGFIANWNNKPADGVLNPDEFWYSWNSADRVDNLHDTIRSQKTFTPEQAWSIIDDSSYADVNAPYFLPLLKAAADSSDNPQVKQAGALLQTWDLQSRDRNGDNYYDEPQTMLFRAFLAQILRDVLADDLGDAFKFFAQTGYPTPGHPTGAGVNIQVGTKTVVDALAGTSHYDFLNGRDAQDVVRDALETTLAELQLEHGEDMQSWRLVAAPRPYLTRNFLGVPQTHESHGMTGPIEQNRGTENNMFVMNAGRVIGYEVTPPGQSGFIGPNNEKSSHYDDQFDLYHTFGKKRMWFYADEVEASKRSETVVKY